MNYSYNKMEGGESINRDIKVNKKWNRNSVLLSVCCGCCTVIFLTFTVLFIHFLSEVNAQNNVPFVPVKIEMNSKDTGKNNTDGWIIHVPDITIRKKKYIVNLTNFDCTTMKVGSVEYAFQHTHISRQFNNISLGCNANWFFEDNIGPYVTKGKGRMKVVIKDTTSINSNINVVPVPNKKDTIFSTGTCETNMQTEVQFNGGYNARLLNWIYSKFHKDFDKTWAHVVCKFLNRDTEKHMKKHVRKGPYYSTICKVESNNIKCSFFYV